METDGCSTISMSVPIDGYVPGEVFIKRNEHVWEETSVEKRELKRRVPPGRAVRWE